MTLLIDELYDGVVFAQNFRINRSLSIAHLRPWIIKWGTPTGGDLVLQVWQGATQLKETRLTATEINTAITSTYFHGQLRFDVEPLQLNHDRKAAFTDYQLRLFTDGMTQDTDNFYGGVRRWEAKFYDTYGDDMTNGEAINDSVEPLGFEIFEYRY